MYNVRLQIIIVCQLQHFTFIKNDSFIFSENKNYLTNIVYILRFYLHRVNFFNMQYKPELPL